MVCTEQDCSCSLVQIPLISVNNNTSRLDILCLALCWAPSYVRELAHMLGHKLITFKKNKKNKKKNKEKRKRGKTHLPRFHQQVDPASSIVRSSWNLEERFETRVAKIWMVEIKFWAHELVLLPVNSNDVFGVYFFQFFFVSFAKRDCIIQDYMCS